LGLSGITDKTFSFCEGNVRWCGTVTLVVCNDFDTVILPYLKKEKNKKNSMLERMYKIKTKSLHDIDE